MIVADTGPLLAAADSGDEAHRLGAALIVRAGRDLVVPDAVAAEADSLIRRRVGSPVARAFLASLAAGKPRRVSLPASLLARAVAIDRQYPHLDLGIVDASVMALAEAEACPILTFDFTDFRATRAATGPWRLLVSEASYLDAIRR
ncbi:MAG: type II toxin-antitoxin system VapC family toxin [Candidatus Limnocylindria bacterium]